MFSNMKVAAAAVAIPAALLIAGPGVASAATNSIGSFSISRTSGPVGTTVSFEGSCASNQARVEFADSKTFKGAYKKASVQEHGGTFSGSYTIQADDALGTGTFFADCRVKSSNGSPGLPEARFTVTGSAKPTPSARPTVSANGGQISSVPTGSVNAGGGSTAGIEDEGLLAGGLGALAAAAAGLSFALYRRRRTQ